MHQNQLRSSVVPRDEYDFLFEIRIDTVKFINAQRILCDVLPHVKYPNMLLNLFSHGIKVTYEYPRAPDLEDDQGMLKAHI